MRAKRALQKIRVFVYVQNGEIFGKSQLLIETNFGKSKRRENGLASLAMLYNETFWVISKNLKAVILKILI